MPDLAAEQKFLVRLQKFSIENVSNSRQVRDSVNPEDLYIYSFTQAEYLVGEMLYGTTDRNLAMTWLIKGCVVYRVIHNNLIKVNSTSAKARAIALVQVTVDSI